MLFAIHAIDRAGALPTRLANYEAHKVIGSLFLIEAPSRAEVEAFNCADPFAAAGIWEGVDQRIHSSLRLSKRSNLDDTVDGRESAGNPLFHPRDLAGLFTRV
jgi:hypothetical protein